MSKKPIYAPIEIKSIEDRKLQANEGDASRSIRKRAFHRALKRGEYWAVSRSQMSLMNRTLHELFYSKVQDAYHLKNPFISSLSKVLE